MAETDNNDGAPAGLPAPLQGALWMVLGGACFASMTVVIRHQTADMNPFEVAFFRNLFGVLVMLPWLWRVGFSGLRTQRLGLHGIRAVVGLVAMTCWFVAISMMPVAEATALSFTTPLFATIGAALFLGEVVKARRWSATVIGFLGALVILRPTDMHLDQGAILALVASAFMSIAVLLVKSLSRTEKPSVIVLYMGLIMTPLSLIPATFFWTAPALDDLVWFIAMGLFATGGQLSMVRAFSVAEVTAVLPFDFSRLLFAAALGYVFFAEQPDMWTWVAAAAIFSATLYTAHREARAAKRYRPVAAAITETIIQDEDPET